MYGWGILAVLVAVHWLCDFTPFSTPWMLAAKKLGWPIHPIFCHAAVHGVMTLMCLSFIFLPVGPEPGDVAVAQFHQFCIASLFILLTHWAIDITKGAIARFFPSTGDIQTSNFWVVLGADQLAHIYILMLVTYRLATPA